MAVGTPADSAEQGGQIPGELMHHDRLGGGESTTRFPAAAPASERGLVRVHERVEDPAQPQVHRLPGYGTEGRVDIDHNDPKNVLAGSSRASWSLPDGSSSPDEAEELPLTRYPLELVASAIFERKPGSRDEVDDRP